MTAPGVALRSRAGTTAVLAVSAGTTGTFLVGTAVVPALPRLSADLGAGFAGEQWVLSIFAVTLSAFLLLGGALGDRYGRRRVHLVGLVVFLACSLGCAAAPDLTLLLAARAGQGVGAALLLPTALALLQGAIERGDHPALLGRWTALSAVAALLGPFLAGSVIDAVSWRAVFLVPVPFLPVALVAVARVPESAEPGAGRVDVLAGTVLAAALGALTFAAISATGDPVAAGVAAVAGLVATGLFVARNRTSRAPLLPADLFRDRRVVVGSVLTFVVYLGFNGSLFLNTLLVQRALGYSPFQAAVAFLPVQATVLALAPAAADHRPRPRRRPAVPRRGRRGPGQRDRPGQRSGGDGRPPGARRGDDHRRRRLRGRGAPRRVGVRGLLPARTGPVRWHHLDRGLDR